MLVRFIAAAMMGWAVIDLALYWLVCRHNNQPLEIFRCILKSLPFLIGVVMLIKARSLADWISDRLDL